MAKDGPGFDVHRARILVALSQFTVPLLSRIYQAFRGDMVTAIVLGEIAHRNVEDWLADQDNLEAPLFDPAHRERVMRPCTALSIAESCGLPRETVRRKVVKLIELGYVYRSDEGYLYITTTVGDGFTDMNATLIEALIDTARRLERLLAQQSASLGPRQVG